MHQTTIAACNAPEVLLVPQLRLPTSWGLAPCMITAVVINHHCSRLLAPHTHTLPSPLQAPRCSC
jgi:hypothetical protein